VQVSIHLHDLMTAVAAPWVALSPRSGQLSGTGAEGVYALDRRVLSVLRVTVDDLPPEPLHVDEPGAATHRYTAAVAGLGDQGHDPTVLLGRRREVDGAGLTETITLTSHARAAVDCRLAIELGTDLAGTAAIRSGAADGLPLTVPTEDGAGTFHWDDGRGTRVTAQLEPAPEQLLSWRVRLEPGEEWTVVLRLTAEFPPATGFRIEPPAEVAHYRSVTVDCDDARVSRWVRRSLDDAAALQLAADRGDRYQGAGPPWYLTLFGRDSLISAGMLVAVDPRLAVGTLRALAQRQGTKVDPETAEQPGKIPHELRADAADHGAGLVIPAAYYGTHDATPLWIMTLHKAWRWGMTDAEVRDLLPVAQRALHWMRDYADPDGDGFLEYRDESGHGLTNQGWKDSPDAVQWPDGRLAEGSIALCEVQGYAYAAAVAGAELLTAFGQDGSYWSRWAAELQRRFRDSYWTDGYPAIALDGSKRPVTGPASNMGHLLGTGLLDAAEEQAVADLLASADLDSGFGLRTLSRRAKGFNPLGYHTGSVWPHDTAMAVQGLYAAGHPVTATSYVRGLTTAAEAFDYRLPELYGGLGNEHERTPTPYPLACRPQAWAAASAIAVLVAALGVSPDVPGGSVRIRPADPFPWRRLEVNGLQIGADVLSLRVEDGDLTILESPPQLRIRD
jgi:glycogen debranching enzyme